MNIPPLAASGIDPVATAGIANVNPVIPSTALAEQQAVLAADTRSSIVDLSTLGQLQAALARFRAQPINDNAAGGSAAVDGVNAFGKFLAATQLIVDALNNFQSGHVDSLLNAISAPADSALPGLDALPATTPGDALLASLKQGGINFQSAGAAGGTAQFSIDLPTLQAAFEANPASTATALAQAFQTLSQGAQSVVAQDAALFSTDPGVTPFDGASSAPAALAGNPDATVAALAALPSPVAAAVVAAAASPAVPSTGVTATPDIALPATITAAAIPVTLSEPVAATATGDATATGAAASTLVGNPAALTDPAIAAAALQQNAAVSNAALAQAIDTTSSNTVLGSSAAAAPIATSPAVQTALPQPAATSAVVTPVVTDPSVTAAAVALAVQAADNVVPPQPAIVAAPLVATSNPVPPNATAAAISAPPQTVNDANALAANAAVLAAAAAFRLGDVHAANAVRQPAELVPAINAVTPAAATTLDPHDDAGDEARKAAQLADQRKQVAAQREALASSYEPLPDHGNLDISV
ncbi:hypothetical protein RCH09_002774 [Actimicrobium sp. GrIS 1.19]|uniref:hypothetical protein n=1 Tax=Actimicrobium sp. GrIS 1.19 TaxID=3071708 RepID=UPI002DFB0FAE|nr:hypothetical protein [Actimicrobium sp. GrIS 1.19]